MKTNIKKALAFSTPVVIFLTVFISWLAGFKEGLMPGLLIGLFVGGLIALTVALIFSDTAKESFADFRRDKQKRPIAKSNRKKLLPNLFILLIGAFLTRYTGKIYLLFITSVVLSVAVTFIQSIKSGEYKKAKLPAGLLSTSAALQT